MNTFLPLLSESSIGINCGSIEFQQSMIAWSTFRLLDYVVEEFYKPRDFILDKGIIRFKVKTK